MVTGDFDPGAKSENLQKYVFDYIPKPFKLTDFLRVVRQAMEVIHNQTL
jgi:DNA-binding NtrC family response regulator